MTAGEVAAALTGARPETLARVVMQVAAMHEPDLRGRCRWCRPELPGWLRWRRPSTPCPTQRVIVATMAAAVAQQDEPRWTPA